MKRYISYALEIIKGHLTHKNIPILVTLCVTNRCNLKCIYCYEEYYERSHREFTTEELLSLIDELSEMGTKYISVNGGEALIRRDIETIVDKIIEAIECLNENRVKFHTHTVLTKNNKDAVDEIMALALKYGFKAQFSPLRIWDSPDKQINLNDNELKEIVKRVLTYKKKGFPVFFSRNSYKDTLSWPFPYDEQMILGDIPKGYRPVRCYIKRFSCHIEANGLVYPCVLLVNKFPALNFLDAGFKKAWKNLENNDCKACYNVCCNDLNRIFGFKPDVLWNAFKIVMDRLDRTQ